MPGITLISVSPSFWVLYSWYWPSVSSVWDIYGAQTLGR